MKKRKVYEKPEMAFYDIKTNEFSGTSEMIQKFRKLLEENEKEVKELICKLKSDCNME